MVQEFHVLRCFSCQTFQVQQVKKSKSWVCKVCGEKQSLIKEFGRGAAVDCRRHVQKLNVLQGRMQEISYEQLESQWDQDEENEEEDVHEGLDEDQLNESQEVSRHVSRWSKYTDPTDEEQDEEEEEEDNVYTERQRFRSQATRKRKKLSGVNSCADGDEDACSGIKRPCQRFGSGWSSGAVDPCRASDLPSSRPAVCRVPGASEESSGNRPQCESSHRLTAVSPALSSRQASEETKSERDSKWDKFLPVVPTQQDEQEFDYQADALSSPRFEASGLGNAVCEQPPPAKPALSFNPLFLTDEDFDDSF